jgi:hypothetical protein
MWVILPMTYELYHPSFVTFVTNHYSVKIYTL